MRDEFSTEFRLKTPRGPPRKNFKTPKMGTDWSKNQKKKTEKRTPPNLFFLVIFGHKSFGKMVTKVKKMIFSNFLQNVFK